MSAGHEDIQHHVKTYIAVFVGLIAPVVPRIW